MNNLSNNCRLLLNWLFFDDLWLRLFLHNYLIARYISILIFKILLLTYCFFFNLLRLLNLCTIRFKGLFVTISKLRIIS